MLSRIKNEFPELFTIKGMLKKVAPKRYKCECGNEFNQTKTINFGGIGFSIATCNKCQKKAKESIAYIIWMRMVNNQIEHEDFILDVVRKSATITKEDLNLEVNNQFKNYTGKALSHLVYFGYLNVNIRKRDELGIIEYSINLNKDNTNRYERIS
ncbi:hypothetical protein MZM54_00645 [[Brevibacterium] frigoritolerans]|nr:hypothetical protein [Peribacillus frigoritolerans]